MNFSMHINDFSITIIGRKKAVPITLGTNQPLK